MAPERFRSFLIVLDGVGVGNAPDASFYGDEGSDTLGNLAANAGGLSLPNLQKLGLGNLSSIKGVDAVETPLASFGRMEEISAGKDSITGHWELCGVVTERPFPTFPNGFPEEIIELVQSVSGRGVIGNLVGSGTDIMEKLGQQHVATGDLILYTSADSVLQILAHEEIIPLEELYRICKNIHQNLPEKHLVSRVIARPFVGIDSDFIRTPNRKDFALEPHATSILDVLSENQYSVQGIGKVDTLFAGRGFSSHQRTKNNAAGMQAVLEQIKSFEGGLVFANLIDFDMLWGHRNDQKGFIAGLEELDRFLPRWLEAATDDDLFLIVADHGNDPTTPSTDHSREHVPLLAWRGKGGNGSNLGIRKGFYDVAATLGDFFRVNWNGPGISFLNQI